MGHGKWCRSAVTGVAAGAGKIPKISAMITNLFISASCVALVLLYLAVMHCCWLGRELQDQDRH